MVVNLTSFVLNPFTEQASFDYKKFSNIAVKAQRLMDDLVDLEGESVDKIIEKIKIDSEPTNIKQVELDLWHKIKAATQGGRRTGLGVTGVGDTLAALNVQYGSDESIKIVEEIYKTLAIGSHTSSCILAAERGAFPVFSWKKEKDNTYLKKIMSACGPDVVEMWMKTGRRNIALTTTAPVGSVSLLTKTTSGIEPAFLLTYKRRRKITQNDITAKIDFIDPMGDKWQEYVVYHHWFKKWMDVTGKCDPKESPYWGGTANDIDWMKSVDIQAAAQGWIDHGISKTVNLPSSATREIVNDAYIRAWKSGCKGLTVYRDGCRTGVLVAADSQTKSQSNNDSCRNAPKRPKELPCDIHKVNVKDSNNETQSWVVLVGLLDEVPYEVFCGLATHIDIPRRAKAGALIKNGKINGIATYHFKVAIGNDDNIIFKDIANLFDNPTQGAFSRTISLALRHGVPVNFIVEQLQKDKTSDMFTFGRSIARVLKSYIPDGTRSMTEKKCKECGSDQIFYSEGCIMCQACSASKCQ